MSALTDAGNSALRGVQAGLAAATVLDRFAYGYMYGQIDAIRLHMDPDRALLAEVEAALKRMPQGEH
ncbi:hypothetical protein CR152_27735 [Massilia violaceinigra]|uniref:Uncharacterized protein n=1 Tax=Massilia violaceinigra TaxID=2045208 RepID=A0A2D2DSA9_9BURK|nr:hypothetical protein [Massilia violaceinigra]ATQ77870.1 hypothetical protein CR152_27735 [Massilia violaceinigra]